MLGENGPVLPVERFLAHLVSVERSPNTVKACPHDLKDWFIFLDGHVNRKLAALTSFCEFHARHRVALSGLLVRMAPAGRGRAAMWSSYKPFLHHITKGTAQRRRSIVLPATAPRAQVLTAGPAQTILEACGHLRDRLLFAVLLDAGLRIGEALGLRHEDLAIAERHLTVRPEVNDNRARAKGDRVSTVPVSAELIRLYADYLTVECGALDRDDVFVILWGEPRGRPWSYPAVYDLVGRLRARTRISFGPHLFRHTYHLPAAQGRRDGEREGAALLRLDQHHRRHLLIGAWCPHTTSRVVLSVRPDV